MLSATGSSSSQTPYVIYWIDEHVTNTDNTAYLSLIRKEFPTVDFRPFSGIDEALDSLKKGPFMYYQIIVSEDLFQKFYEAQKTEEIQSKYGIILTMFILSSNPGPLLEKLTTYKKDFGCTGMCSIPPCFSVGSSHKEMTAFIKFFDSKTKQVGTFVKGFSEEKVASLYQERTSPFLTRPMDLNPQKKPTEGSVRGFACDSLGYIGHMMNSTPRIYNHIILPVPVIKDNLTNVLVNLSTFLNKKNVPEDEMLYILSQFFISPACFGRKARFAYLARLWTEDSTFSRLAKQALMECNADDLKYLRFVIRELSEIYFQKTFPYYAGTVYKGLDIQDQETLENFSSLVGETIYFETFVGGSKSKENVSPGNVLLEIETISKEIQDKSILFSNADISSISHKKEEEVLFSLMSIFTVKSVEKIDDKYVIKLLENSGAPFLMMLRVVEQ